MDMIVKNLQQSYRLYLKNFSLLLLASAIAGLITFLSLGLLAGPVLGGFLLLGVKLLRGEKGDLNEIFTHFDQFLSTLMPTLLLWGAGVVFYIIGAIPVIGRITNFVVSPVLFLLYFLTIGFIVEQKSEPLQALKRSVACFAMDWVQLWLYSLVMMVIGGIGFILFGVGVILTVPVGMMGMVLVYRQLAVVEPFPFKPEKQIVLKGGIALSALLVIGIVCLLFGFGRMSSPTLSTSLTSKIISGITGQKIEVDQKGGRFKLGGLSFGSGLPENFPKDIPVYPQAEVDGFIGGKDGELSGSTTILTSKDSAAKIYDYYVKNLEDKGWVVTSQDLGEMKMISFQKDKRSGVITINPNAEQCDIIIGLTME